MAVYQISVTADHVSTLWHIARDVHIPDADSELWLLHLDMILAFRRFGRRNTGAIAEYLSHGRETWGVIC